MTNPYQAAVVVTEHVVEKDTEHYTDGTSIDVLLAHTQVVHDDVLDPAKECIGDGISPIRTVQLLSSALATLIQDIGDRNTALAATVAYKAIQQIIDHTPDVKSQPPQCCKLPQPLKPPQPTQRIKGEFSQVSLTDEQLLALDMLERNPAFRKKQ